MVLDVAKLSLLILLSYLSRTGNSLLATGNSPTTSSGRQVEAASVSSQKIVAKRIFSKLRSFSKELESVTEQFTTVKEALNTNPRNRRSLIDGDGSAQKN
ncbi:hypothetical protein OUZ56_005426 [Daphnia magna]|uniref:Secreted protein n=1 Tax=Daphnia magna TaxID=35525 RepID=A0ABQ9YT90_9CRUS|nr:hypothetical protein OUZ56_005426 [Daphnia magna]